MAEARTVPGTRARRSTRISRQLAEVRQRNADQLAEQRAREQRVDDALEAYVLAEDRIAAADEECRKRIEPHERAIEQLREQARQRVAEERVEQQRSALAIHEAGRTVEQVAELLEVSEKEARRLIAAGRQAEAESEGTSTPEAAQQSTAEGPSPETASAEPTQGPPAAEDSEPSATSGQIVGEGAHLGWVDGHQNGVEAAFAPAVSYDGGQGT